MRKQAKTSWKIKSSKNDAPSLVILTDSRVSDYASKPELDRYDDTAIDDEDQDEISAEARRKAEYVMSRRDRREGAGKKAGRASGRRRAPAFLDDDLDDEDGMEDEALARMRRRTRHVYDERRDEDDMDGVEDASDWCSGLPLCANPSSRNYLWSN